MSKLRFPITCNIVFLLLGWPLISGGTAAEESALSRVDEIKQIVRSEGKYGEVSLSNRKFLVGRRIVMLERMKSPEGVAGLIEIILDPGFIEFDRKFARDENGDRLPMRVNDPLIGPMVKICWRLYTQPLVDEAAIPSAAQDRSREYRRHGYYGGYRIEELVADCSAWCREVQAGRMTFQMEGDPTRYNRNGKPASESRSVRREHRNEMEKSEVSSVKGGSLMWVYVLLSVLIAVVLGMAIKQKTAKV